MSREHNVRAAGADRSLQKFVLAKFPGAVPDLRGPGPWRLGRHQEGPSKDWSLESDQSETKFRGVPDGGIAGATPSNYFILIKQRGADDFLAIPVDEWATFKPVAQRGQFSLEDAEAQMKYRRLQAERANPRLAQAIGAEDAAGAPPGSAPPGDEEADSDEEWKDIKARAASLAAMGGNTTAAANNNTRRATEVEEYDAGAPPELTMDEAVYVPKPRDAEDWEHESEAADDDLDMGGASESEVEVSPSRGPVVSDSDGEGDMDASKVKRAIRRMMRETGLEESEASEASGDEEEDDDAEDEEDLDRMASGMLPGAGGSGEAAGMSLGVGRKRKTPPPPAVATIAGSATITAPSAAAIGGGSAGSSPVEAAAKKARTSPGPTTTAAVVPGIGPPTEAEVVALLKSRGKLSVKDISSAFAGRLTTPEARKNFSALFKKVAKLGPADAQGTRFLTLR